MRNENPNNGSASSPGNVAKWSSVPIVGRPMQKSSYVHISYVGTSKEMKIVENYEMKLFILTSPP